MRDPHQNFIEKMGLIREQDGLPRIAGRLMGLLILEEGPFSLDELAVILAVSKASISTNARLLEHAGIAEHIGQPGDRRDYYGLAPDMLRRTVSTAQRRLRETRDLLAETAAQLPAADETARGRIIEMRDFYAFFIAEFDAMMERWEERPRGGSDGEAALDSDREARP